ncbi:hypothetical protein GC093_27920 [Paenibacillus sp. LMG 31456]|uniref:Uncharacterized protein n=1 Tax=Paenibacillus foliorum TaxID=2654974 RepID=A0A972H080_9BACL|nr:hypothetical protein [Paenibacillus foliorum]NOU97022.1 hypothetical protein [Paenibacillus foliorum]
MKAAIINAITKAKSRKSLYHFTRVTNLSAIAHYDALLSSYNISPHLAGERRSEARVVNYYEFSVTLNAHLRIPDSMIDHGITQEQFRECLNRHVFFWPTLKDCQKMMDTYARREPEEGFAVLEFDANSLLAEHFSSVKLSKYDSGSSPRFPKHCSYKKSLAMFLPLRSFKSIMNKLVPTNASEIKEVLIEDQVNNVSQYLRTVYVDSSKVIPLCWRDLAKPMGDLQVIKSE